MILRKGRVPAVLALVFIAAVVQGLPVDVVAQTYFSGQVTDSQNNPIVGATVEAGYVTLVPPGAWSFVADGQVSTNAQGRYAITALDSANSSGQYVLVAQAPSYVTTIYPDLRCVDLTCLEIQNLPTYGPNITANFVLQKGASISGNISRTDTHSPVAGAQVSLLSHTAGNITVDNAGSFATADSQGNYQLSDLPAGDYTLYVQNAEYPLLMQWYAGHDVDDTLNVSGDTVTVVEGQVLGAIDFPLDPGATISGSLTSTINAAPVSSGVSVSRTGANAVAGYVGMGAGVGEYQSRLLAPGSFYVQFGQNDDYTPLYFSQASTAGQAKIVTLSVGQNLGGISAQLTPTRTIAGIVTNSATYQALQGARIHAGTYTVSPFAKILTDVSDASSDASGNYLLQGLDSSTNYYIWVDGVKGYIPEFYPTATPCCISPPAGATSYALGGNEQATGFNFALQKGAYASGRIYDPMTNGDIPGLQVQIYDSNGNPVASTSTGYPDSPLSDGQGNYYTAAVPSGNYYLGISTSLGTVLYPNVICPGTGCVYAKAQLVKFSAAQDYPKLDFAVPNLDLIFRGNFDQ